MNVENPDKLLRFRLPRIEQIYAKNVDMKEVEMRSFLQSYAGLRQLVTGMPRAYQEDTKACYFFRDAAYTCRQFSLSPTDLINVAGIVYKLRGGLKDFPSPSQLCRIELVRFIYWLREVPHAEQLKGPYGIFSVWPLSQRTSSQEPASEHVS